MKRSNSGKYILLLAVWAAALIACIVFFARGRLTYLEFTTVNEQCDYFETLRLPGEQVRQEFTAPYDMLDSVSILIGTFAKDNNSTWNFALEDETGKVLYQDRFHASLLENNAYYRHQFKHRVKAEKGARYWFCIAAADVSDVSALAFYRSDTTGDTPDDTSSDTPDGTSGNTTEDTPAGRLLVTLADASSLQSDADSPEPDADSPEADASSQQPASQPASGSLQPAEPVFSQQEAPGSLCFKLYGGDRDPWWTGFTCVIFLYLLVMIIRALHLSRSGRNPKEDIILQGMAAGALAFILLASFAVGTVFTDENDNIRGALTIARGGVLYRDYVTQHTPFTYYLCSLFALSGASSVEQFRLAYYFLQGIFWCLLYIRHAGFFGKRRMLLMPVLEAVCTSSIISPQGFQILSDGVQGLLSVALMLEFLRYRKDKKLGMGRSVIISLCVWGMFGAAFISAYALAPLVVAVLYSEVRYWTGKTSGSKPGGNKTSGSKSATFTIGGFLRRYAIPALCLVIPPAAAAVYFKANHALARAVEMFYTFNREIYPKYVSGFGNRLFQPFITAAQSFFNTVTGDVTAIVAGSATAVTLLRLVLIVLAVTALLNMWRRGQRLSAACLFLVMVCSASRGYGFHGLGAWYIAIMVIALEYDSFRRGMIRLGKPVLITLGIVLLSTYAVAAGSNLVTQQRPVSELESRVVQLTEEQEDKRIFIDAYCLDSIYLLAKGRDPVNPAHYMLPWYMDWYEKDNILALLDNMPAIAVYNEDRKAWDYTHYTEAFDGELKNYYRQLGDEGWQKYVWIQREEDVPD